uniref:Uncharacterized protein n=1 Tax=Setaria viridis TaxID=4556 RepID=A0A4U6T6W3_SETVI|nr:hypothetical protein SEVIR_9G461850v2 [Setaria viridis]
MWGTARHRSPGGSPAPGSLPPLLWKSDVAPAGEPTAAIAVEPDAAAPAGESAALAGTLVGEPATAAPVGGRAVPAAALAGEPVVAVAAARTGERAAPIAAPCSGACNARRRSRGRARGASRRSSSKGPRAEA